MPTRPGEGRQHLTSVKHAASAGPRASWERLRRGPSGFGALLAAFAVASTMSVGFAASAQAQDDAAAATDGRIPEPLAEDSHRVQGNDNTTFQVDHRTPESGAFAVEVSYTADRLPDGRYREGRIACKLIADAGPFGTAECDSRVAAGQALDRHGPARWQVVRLECSEGQRCVSQREVRFTVHGVMGPTRILLDRTVRAQASHVERDRRRAQGFGFPLPASFAASCRDERLLAEPLSRSEASLTSLPSCRGTLTVRSAQRLPLPRAESRLLGRSAFALSGGPGEKLGIYFDGGREPAAGGIRFTLALERLLRRRGWLPIVAELSWSDGTGERRSSRQLMTLRAPRTRPRGCRTGCRT